MDFTGKRVCHRTLGEGKIIRQEGNIIWARFPGRADAMRFSMPGCFESFLTLPDAEAKVAAQRELEEKKRLQLRAEEEEHRREDALRPSIRAIPLSGAKFPSVPVYRDMASFFAAQERALEEEIRAMQCNSKNQRISIRNGERMERRGDLFVYAFESETELNLPDGIPLRLWRGRMEWKGTLLGCDDVTIYIAVEADLGERVESMEFSAEAWQLLRFLNNHLAELCDAPSALVRSLVLDGRRMDLCTEEIRTGQEQALRMVLAQTISFLWGPPGTGKTHTLAKIALQFLARKKRVLMLSYSNISVDGAALRVLSMDVHPVPGKIVRYGYPRDQRVSEHEYLNSYNLVMRRHPDLLAERQALLVERRGLSAVNRHSLEIRERLQEIHDQLREEEAAAVRQAAFVATTVSKAVIDANLYGGKFDVVIFDEASMALVPQLVFAASLAKERFICIGDFAQLPPIVQSGSDSTLNVDIFRFCGIAEAVERGQGHRWLCMLDEQHRMHPDIADFASRCMYRGLLRSASGLAAQRRGIVRDAPFPGKVLVLSDLSGMMSVCRKMSSGSRINVLSALVSMGLAICAAWKHAVGLITPYHAQARLLHAMARDLAETPQELCKISCATVHQFQGSEQDVVIFDAVDCYFSKHPGILLTSDQNDSANRLFNVALSRAKGKFIAVANGDYFLHGGLPKRLMLRQLLDELRANRSSCFSGDELQKETSQGPKASPLLFPGVAAVPAYRWFAPGEGDASFRADLAAAQKEILIDMPVPCGLDDEQGQRLAQALKRAMQRGVGIVLRTPEPDRLPQSLRNFASVEKYVTDPVTIIDRKLSWFGEPTSGANFTSRGVEFPTRFRPQIRFAGRRFAISLLNDLSMGKGKKTTPASLTKGEGIYPDFRSYVKGELTCPECGSPLQLHRNKYTGIFFLGCSRYPRCAYTEKLEPEILEGYFYFHNADGKHCPHDGTTLEAKTGRYGVYARCCAAARHSFSLDNV